MVIYFLHYRPENYNTSTVEFLGRLSGVTNSNYRSIMDGCKSLVDLDLLPVERLAELMGEGERGSNHDKSKELCHNAD